MTFATIHSPIVRHIVPGDLRANGLEKLIRACEAISHHFSSGLDGLSTQARDDRAFMSEALSDVAKTTRSNETRLGDKLLELSEAVHALRNSIVRHRHDLGARRFSVLTGVMDCLLYAEPDDVITMDYIAYVVFECLQLRELPQLFLLSRALSDVKEFTHGRIA